MNIQNLMQQAQKMQKKMLEAEEAFRQEKISAESGGGAVKITMNGDMKILEMTIAEDLYKDDREMLQDLIIAAVNNGVETVRKEKEARMSKIVGKMGSGLPGMF